MSTTKRVKTSLAAALVPVVMLCLAAPAQAQLSVPPPPIKSYEGDPGTLGDPASWRTPEFLRDNGMLSIGAEFAYAAGYAGAGMNIGIVDSGTFAGHMREHGSLDTNYTVGDRFISVVAQGGDTGPTSGFYNQAFNDTPRHARQRHGRREPRRRRRDAADGPVANMHGVAFNTDLYIGNTGQDRRRALRQAAGDRDRRADAGQRLHRQRLPRRERRGDGGRQADPADHLELGQPAQHRELQHLRHAGRRPGELRSERVVAPPVHCRRASRTPNGKTVALAQRRDRGRAHRHDHPVHRRQRRLRATRRRAAPRRTSCPTSRAAGTRRRASTRRPGARSTPTGRCSSRASRRSTSAASRSGRASRRRPTTSTAPPCRSSTACRSRATGARRARRWPARTRRPCWRWSCSASRT